MVIQNRPYSRAVIAMSAYNAIAISGGRADKATIFDILIRVQHPLLEILQLERALKALVRRKYIKEENRFYSMYDSQRRVSVCRDLSDVRLNSNGIPVGGWKGWKVRDLADGLIPIEEVINGV
jgi:hypothetical protein